MKLSQSDYQRILEEIRNWVKEIGDEADKVIICNGTKELTPKDILKLVEDKDEFGMEFIESWKEIESIQDGTWK